jgi:hypothetical protein
MAGHSRTTDGVASLAYVPAIDAFDFRGLPKERLGARDI